MARLKDQWIRASVLVTVHLGRQLEQDNEAIGTIQKLLDGGFVARDATFDLQCLGIVFGKLIVETVMDVDWAMVEDEYGRDPAVRYLDTSLLVFPMTMISKRVEEGKEVDVREMFDGVVAQLEHLKRKVDRPN